MPRHPPAPPAPAPADAIRDAMAGLEITQADVASVLGIAQGNVAKMLGHARPRDLQRLAFALVAITRAGPDLSPDLARVFAAVAEAR